MSDLHSSDARPWEQIPGAPLLKAWATELRTACLNADDREWRDVGRAVIILADDTRRGKMAAQRVAVDAGMKFISIDAEDVMDLPPRNNFRKMTPALMYLEPGRWVQGPQQDENEEFTEQIIAFQRHLVTWIDEFDVAKPIVLVTANNGLGNMSGVIDTPGAFDRYFALPPVPLAQLGEAFIDDLGQENCGESLRALPAKLGRLLKQDFASDIRRERAVLYLRRLRRREQRPVEFLDLMHLSTHGFAEEGPMQPDSDDARRHVAMHEGGHAAMAILDSSGKNTPDYCSIVPGAYFNGIVAESVSYHQSLEDRTTYASFRHRIRIGLAGRAAEELAFGPENVSSGASGDLESAWERVYSAFAHWGFAPGMTTADKSASNLAVVVSTPTLSEYAHVEGLIRQFLAEEYQHVLKRLADNRSLLDAIADRLMWDPIVDQDELKEICGQFPTAD
jgi:cell division protease FtsH